MSLMTTDENVPEFLLSQGFSAQSSRSCRSAGRRRRNAIRSFSTEQIGTVDTPSYADNRQAAVSSDEVNNDSNATLTMDYDSLTADASMASGADMCRMNSSKGNMSSEETVITVLLSILKGEVYV
ncbi:hypothetical protein LPJ53_001547 [Coemansia erecta]|uniref:Uncharacterized protein n=1 Tax=Coemansia erecta TaxID=147472 RepID=A0A9W8CS12_9FUNG|nr:hypothetical protein LPJ53_001547 [Coemansia erecta]